MIRVLAASVLLLLGGAVGLAAVALYDWWWGLLLAAAASLSAVWALPPRWYTLLPFAVGWWVPLLIAWAPRREGDYAIAGDAQGYGVIALGTVVVVGAAFIVALRWPARRSGPRDAR